MSTRIRIICIIALIGGVAAGRAEDKPFKKPVALDMMLVGRVGAARSEVSRSVIVAGEYAYVSGEPGLATVRVGKDGKLTLTDEWTQSSLKVNGGAIAGDTLYIANWSPGAGLAVFDLKDPAHPRHLRSIRTPAHVWACDVHENLLDVAVDDGTITGIVTYDISKPREPREVHFLRLNDRLVGNGVRLGRHLYFTHQKWLYVYDTTEPTKPRRVREIAFNGLAGKLMIRGEHLLMLSRAISKGEEGGFHVLSLKDPSNPRPIAHWKQEEPRDMHIAGNGSDAGNRLVVPCSGSGVYTLDLSDITKPKQIAHFYLNWPKSGEHGGYPVCVALSANLAILGTTAGNNPECRDDPKCAYGGGRLYSVMIGD